MVKQREVMASPHGAASAAGAPVALGAGRMAVDLAAPSLSDAARTRRVLTLAAVAALMAGCASRPARPTAGGEASAPSARRTPPAPIPASQPPLELDPAAREASVAQAMLLVNTPYRYGGNTPEGGFDCSGLVAYVLQAVATPASRRLPRSTAQWAAASTPIDDGELKRGDLVFFNTSGARFSHMGIYVGEGKFVHAPSTGGTVRLQNLSDKYFAQRYTGARSVFAGGG